MNFLGLEWYQEKVYGGQFAVYIFGWVLTSFVFMKAINDRPGYLPLGYKYKKLKIVGLSSLWPLYVIMTPLLFFGALVWMFLRPSKD
jgi:hypothetical protein